MFQTKQLRVWIKLECSLLACLAVIRKYLQNSSKCKLQEVADFASGVRLLPMGINSWNNS